MWRNKLVFLVIIALFLGFQADLSAKDKNPALKEVSKTSYKDAKVRVEKMKALLAEMRDGLNLSENASLSPVKSSDNLIQQKRVRALRGESIMLQTHLTEKNRKINDSLRHEFDRLLFLTAQGDEGQDILKHINNADTLLNVLARRLTMPCGYCKGSGHEDYSAKPCGVCGGDGYVTTPENPKQCMRCNGTGREAYSTKPCVGCKGTGWAEADGTGNHHGIKWACKPCGSCKGTGHPEYSSKTCVACDGDGYISAPEDSKFCAGCKGSGHIEYSSKPCPGCKGMGWAEAGSPPPWAHHTAKSCGFCKGTGHPEYSTKPCAVCGGDGYVSAPNYSVQCGACKGTGHPEYSNKYCPGCKGTGWAEMSFGADDHHPGPNPHPGYQNWNLQICGLCKGAGKDVFGRLCSPCGGDGYLAVKGDPHPCAACQGNGKNVFGQACNICQGTGWAETASNPTWGGQTNSRICGFCEGKGSDVFGRPCTICGGDGYVTAPSDQKTCASCKGEGRDVFGRPCPACQGGGWARSVEKAPETGRINRNLFENTDVK